MGDLLLLLVVALTVAAIVFGLAVLIIGNDPGLAPAEPASGAVPLPTDRPLREADVTGVRFDTALRGYRMAQVDQAVRRAAYDIGYKDELIGVLEAEVTALREGRVADADELRRARLAALAPAGTATRAPGDAAPADPVGAAGTRVTGVPAATDPGPPDVTTPTTPATPDGSDPGGATGADGTDGPTADRSTPAGDRQPVVVGDTDRASRPREAAVADHTVPTENVPTGSVPTGSVPGDAVPTGGDPAGAVRTERA
jgi:DivIVA domain-containing protein